MRMFSPALLRISPRSNLHPSKKKGMHRIINQPPSGFLAKQTPLSRNYSGRSFPASLKNFNKTVSRPHRRPSLCPSRPSNCRRKRRKTRIFLPEERERGNTSPGYLRRQCASASIQSITVGADVRTPRSGRREQFNFLIR